MEHIQKYLYLLISPFTGIIASMLDPRAFTSYMIGKIGDKNNNQVVLIEINWEKLFSMAEFKTLENKIVKSLVPHPDGRPKRSVHILQYQALEFTPLDAMKNLYLGQKNGLVLEIEKGEIPEMTKNRSRYLIQMISPRQVMIASKLSPFEFIKGFTTDPVNIISFPKIMLIDMKISGLANNLDGDIKELMYPDSEGLSECFTSLERDKLTKMSNRNSHQIYWPMIRTGFFVGSGNGIIYYPYPEKEKHPESEIWFHFSWTDQ